VVVGGFVDELRKTLGRSARIARQQGLRTLANLAWEKARKHEFHVLGPSISDADYARWIETNESTSQSTLLAQRSAANQLVYQPTITIITPVWNPQIAYLTAALDSVLLQTYSNWELCVADGGSNDDVRNVLQKYAERDARVHVQFLGENLGISENSNKAIQFSQGEFVTFLDHDDLLAPNALFEIADKLNQRADIDIMYSDSDRITHEGNRTDPFFKPDWSPEMMVSGNYLAHLCLIRSCLVKALGGFRHEMDGAQDWDLFLRATDRTANVSHLPKILYHWRETSSSVSSAGYAAKPYAKNAQRLAVDEYLKRNRLPAKASFQRSGCLKALWDLPDRPLISIIIWASKTSSSIKRCVHSIIRESSYKNFEILVVSSEDQTLSAVDRVRVVMDGGALDYSSANNLGASEAKGQVLVFLNDRLEVLSSDWLEQLAGWALLPQVAAVGAKILYPDHRIFHGGVIAGLPGYLFQGMSEGRLSLLGHTEWYRDLVAVSGGCLATKTKLFRDLGGFETKHSEAADVGFCLRARIEGGRVLYIPYARLILRGISQIAAPTAQMLEMPDYRRIMAGGDPYFNPNLSYENTIPMLSVRK